MRRLTPLAIAAVLVTSACGPTVDLTTGLQIEGISTGWLNAGVVDGRNKLVPPFRAFVLSWRVYESAIGPLVPCFRDDLE